MVTCDMKGEDSIVTQAQQERPEFPTVTFTWHACKYKVRKLYQRYILKKGGPQVA